MAHTIQFDCSNAEKIKRDVLRLAVLLLGVILFLSGMLPLFFRAFEHRNVTSPHAERAAQLSSRR